MNIESNTVYNCEYKITDIDFWEQDAILEVGGERFYFQFSQDRLDKLTIVDALKFLQSESKYYVKEQSNG